MVMDWVAQGAALATALKRLQKLAQDAKDVELQESILSLREFLAEQREANLGLRNENTKLKADFDALQRRLAVLDQIEHDGVLYWLVDSGGNRKGPYCPKCYGESEKLVLLSQLQQERGAVLRCETCRFFITANDARGSSNPRRGW